MQVLAISQRNCLARALIVRVTTVVCHRQNPTLCYSPGFNGMEALLDVSASMGLLTPHCLAPGSQTAQTAPAQP